MDLEELEPTNYDELKIHDIEGIIDWFSSGKLPCVNCQHSCGKKKCREKIGNWLLKYDQSK